MNEQVWLLVIEFLFVATLLAGVALVHVPAALILGGAMGVLACERHARSIPRRPGK